MVCGGDDWDLSNQHLTTLRKNTFTGLKKLLTLDLSGNRIQHIDKGAFSGLLNIISINLSNNRIQHICDTVFQGLLHLHTLDISQNSIDDIGESVFLGLPSLETLETDSYKFCCLAHSAVHCLPEADEFSSCEDLMSSQVLRISIWVLGVVALCGNFVVIFWRVRDFRGGRVSGFFVVIEEKNRKRVGKLGGKNDDRGMQVGGDISPGLE
ncbi:G-protein coupled receptor GRL101-like [Aplysia californica]|uniref:G-protein coupled receptor GRL101-like n=1 Tax=Aplysia californica TaxID=6500 RepID=A0ABM1VYH1_APLCA|nr:G-protein coupled receptor GRL101-like [Aplysia californica]